MKGLTCFARKALMTSVVKITKILPAKKTVTFRGVAPYWLSSKPIAIIQYTNTKGLTKLTKNPFVNQPINSFVCMPSSLALGGLLLSSVANPNTMSNTPPIHPK